jgi:hypothetical protein
MKTEADIQREEKQCHHKEYQTTLVEIITQDSDTLKNVRIVVLTATGKKETNKKWISQNIHYIHHIQKKKIDQRSHIPV